MNSDRFQFITLNADADALEKARLFVIEFAENIELPPGKIFKLELALEEIIVNVTSYAYPAGQTGTVQVGCFTEQNTITVTIRDTGAAFNPLMKETPDLEQDIEDREIGGLGIFLTREMVDNISYQREQDTNITTFSVKGTPQRYS